MHPPPESAAGAGSAAALSAAAVVPGVSLHRRAAAFGLSAAFVSSAGQSFFIGLFGAPVQAELGLTPALWGLIYGTATLASGLLMFWLGALADRVPLPRAIGLALALLGTGAALMAASTGPVWLLAAFFALRLGGQGLTGHLAIVAATRYARQRGRSIATAALGFILGEAILPLGVVAMLLLTDWRWVWAGVAVLVWGLALPALRRVAAPLRTPSAGSAGGVQSPTAISTDSADRVGSAGNASAANPSAGDPSTARTSASQSATAAGGLEAPPPATTRRTLLRDRRFRAALAVVLVPPVVVTALFLHIGSVMALRDWSAAQVAGGLLAFAAMQAAAGWLSGRWVDRHGVGSVFRVYLLPMALAALVLGLAPAALATTALWVLYLGMGMTAGANNVLAGALWAELFGLRSLGLVRGVYVALMVVATAVAPMAFGAALSAALPLAVLGLGVAAYAVLVPLWAGRVLFSGKGRLAGAA